MSPPTNITQDLVAKGRAGKTQEITAPQKPSRHQSIWSKPKTTKSVSIIDACIKAQNTQVMTLTDINNVYTFLPEEKTLETPVTPLMTEEDAARINEYFTQVDPSEEEILEHFDSVVEELENEEQQKMIERQEYDIYRDQETFRVAEELCQVVDLYFPLAFRIFFVNEQGIVVCENYNLLVIRDKDGRLICETYVQVGSLEKRVISVNVFSNPSTLISTFISDEEDLMCYPTFDYSSFNDEDRLQHNPLTDFHFDTKIKGMVGFSVHHQL